MAVQTAGKVLLQRYHYDRSVASPFCADRLGQQWRGKLVPVGHQASKPLSWCGLFDKAYQTPYFGSGAVMCPLGKEPTQQGPAQPL